jgi:hypothetical protein
MSAQDSELHLRTTLYQRGDFPHNAVLPLHRPVFDEA